MGEGEGGTPTALESRERDAGLIPIMNMVLSDATREPNAPRTSDEFVKIARPSGDKMGEEAAGKIDGTKHRQKALVISARGDREEAGGEKCTTAMYYAHAHTTGRPAHSV